MSELCCKHMREPLSFQNGALACLRREKSWGLKQITRPLAKFCWMKCWKRLLIPPFNIIPVSYTHLRAHETRSNLVCRLLLEKKNAGGERQGNGSEEGMKEDISTTSWRNWRSKTRRNIKTWCEWVKPILNEYWATSNRILLANKSLVGIIKVISPKERLALTISHTQNCLALLPSFHPWWPWLRLLNCACAWSTMLKERGKWLQLRFNIPNILENKRNVCLLYTSPSPRDA